MRLHQARRTGIRRVFWPKPQRQGRWAKCLWNEWPESRTLRVVRFRVEVPSFRTKHIAVVTTLLDEACCPDSAIEELYLRRWQVELNFRDIKTAHGFDVFLTRSSAMIGKEIHLQAIAYNLVRLLMLEAARPHDVSPNRISFNRALSAWRAFVPLFAASAKDVRLRFEDLLIALAADPVPLRPHRVEPRAVKRRPKPFQNLTKPRRRMRVSGS